MIDCNAPIIPGKSAGGIAVGSRIEDVLRDAGDLFTATPVVNPFFPESEWLTRYRSSAVDLWVKDGRVEQVGVHDHYRGKLADCIAVGSTVGDVEDYIGAWEENFEDVLVVPSLPGLCFEVSGGECPACRREAGQTYRHIPISELFVFAPED